MSQLLPVTSTAKSMEEQPHDYTNWSNNDLIKRVTDLELELRAQNARHLRLPPSNRSPVSPKKKPKKAAKAFDPSRYSTRLIALKFAYLGSRYNGFEHHSNNVTPLPTVEEVLWKALRKTRLILPQIREGQSEDEVSWDGCEYSKCGRTDRGVSAFGQVVGLRVRSARPKQRDRQNGVEMNDIEASGSDAEPVVEPAWHRVKDELPYIQLLNRVLPPDIRVLAWCPDPPAYFSARFNCKERRYRYFFTNPAYVPMPSSTRDGEAWLDIQAMREAARKLKGLHDLRNFCKVDPGKQITNFERRIFHTEIESVLVDQEPGAFLDRQPYTDASHGPRTPSVGKPKLYYFEVRGSAFLWHQVRHMVAILFLVGQGYENPSVVDNLLDVQKTPAKPMYDMASDTPLVLWDCVFPEEVQTTRDEQGNESTSGYEDGLNWIYIGDEADTAAGPTRYAHGIEDRKYGRLSIMEDVWALWRIRKMDEVLAGSLMDVVARQGTLAVGTSLASRPERLKSGDISARIFDGSETPKPVGKYVPIMQRERMEPPEVVNARYAARKGLDGGRRLGGDANIED